MCIQNSVYCQLCRELQYHEELIRCDEFRSSKEQHKALNRFCMDPHENLEFIHCYSCCHISPSIPYTGEDDPANDASDELSEFETIDLGDPVMITPKPGTPKVRLPKGRQAKHSFLKQALDHQTRKSAERMVKEIEAKLEAIQRAKAEPKKEGQ